MIVSQAENPILPDKVPPKSKNDMPLRDKWCHDIGLEHVANKAKDVAGDTVKLYRGYDLLNRILGETKTTDNASSSELTPPTAEWLTIDYVVLTWIFTTLSKILQQRLVVENPKTAKEAWDILALIFNNNKRSRSIALKVELRLIKLGDLSIDAYFRKIESIATILYSLLSLISNDDVVNIALDGLPDKYQHVSDIIIHQDPFSDLKTVYSMLTMMEMHFKSRAQATYVDFTSSSPMVLLASSVTNTQRHAPSTESLLYQFTTRPNLVISPLTRSITSEWSTGSERFGLAGSGSSVGSAGFFRLRMSTSRTGDAIAECFSCCGYLGSRSSYLEHGYRYEFSP
nr:hybrid signal transduction histidine kinase M [Tanacetum cinerariifolium]